MNGACDLRRILTDVSRGNKRAAVSGMVAAALLFLSGCEALSMRTDFRRDSAEVAVAVDYRAAQIAFARLLGQWRGAQGLPDFLLAPPDADTLGGRRK